MIAQVRTDYNPSQPRGKDGRWAAASLLGSARTGSSASVGTGSLNTDKSGPSGQMISGGEAYTQALFSDPKVKRAHDKVQRSRQEIAEIKAQMQDYQSQGKQPPLGLVKKHNRTAVRGSGEMEAFADLAEPKLAEVRQRMKADSTIPRSEAEQIVRRKNVQAVGVRNGREAKQKLTDDLVDFVEFTGSDPPSIRNARIDGRRDRSWASPGGKEVVITALNTSRGEVFHEAAHHIEFNNPKLVEAADDWVMKRSNYAKPISMAAVDPAYDPGELAQPNHFSNPYVGKLYRQGGRTQATEVLSMGMQFMGSPREMSYLLAADPEHFHFTLGAIAQNRRKEKRRDYKQDLISTLREDKGMGVWFEGRRTPIAVNAETRSNAIVKARKKLVRGGNTVTSARELNESERKQAAKGTWIRSGPNGEKPGESKLRGHGPPPKSKKDEWREAYVFLLEATT